MSATVPGIGPFRTLNLEELLALELPELDWAVEGILPMGSFTLLAAREKAGKSLLAVDLCCSIALGEPFLDRAVKQGPALLVPAEENIRDVRDRIMLRLDGRTDADLHILPVNGFTDDELRIDQDESLMRLMATIEQLQPVVIVLDPMRELHVLAENDADDMGPMLRPMRQIAHNANTAMVLNHHMSRMGSARGSTAIRASVDQEWAFKRTDDESAWDQVPTEGVLRIEGRFGPRQMIGLRLAPKVRWEPANITLVSDSNLRGRIINLLQRTPDGLDADGIAEELGATKKTVQNTISTMLRERPPQILSSGRGVANDPRRFLAVDPFLLGEPSVPSIPGNIGNEYSRSRPIAIWEREYSREYSQNGTVPKDAGIYVCLGCGLPRSVDTSPCPTCGRTEGIER